MQFHQQLQGFRDTAVWDLRRAADEDGAVKVKRTL